MKAFTYPLCEVGFQKQHTFLPLPFPFRTKGLGLQVFPVLSHWKVSMALRKSPTACSATACSQSPAALALKPPQSNSQKIDGQDKAGTQQEEATNG